MKQGHSLAPVAFEAVRADGVERLRGRVSGVPILKNNRERKGQKQRFMLPASLSYFRASRAGWYLLDVSAL